MYLYKKIIFLKITSISIFCNLKNITEDNFWCWEGYIVNCALSYSAERKHSRRFSGMGGWSHHVGLKLPAWAELGL